MSKLLFLLFLLFIDFNGIYCSYFIDPVNGEDSPTCGSPQECKSIGQLISNFRANATPQGPNSTLGDSLTIVLLDGIYKGSKNRNIDLFNLDVTILPLNPGFNAVFRVDSNDQDKYSPIFYISNPVSDGYPTKVLFSHFVIDYLYYSNFLQVDQTVAEFNTNIDLYFAGVQTRYTSYPLVSIKSNSLAINNIQFDEVVIKDINQDTSSLYLFLLSKMNSIRFLNTIIQGTEITGIAIIDSAKIFDLYNSEISDSNYLSSVNAFAFFNCGRIEFKNSTFSSIILTKDSYSDQTNGLIAVNGTENLYITNCTFNDIDGRNILAIDTNLTITHSIFSNSEFIYGHGSVIYSVAKRFSSQPYYSELRVVVNTIENCTFSNHNLGMSINQLGKGSTIYIEDNTKTYIKNCKFLNNNLGSITSKQSPISISNSTQFLNNGGSIFCDTYNLEFLDSTTQFTNNSNVKTNSSSFDSKTSQGVLCYSDYDQVYIHGCLAKGPKSYKVVEEINKICQKNDSKTSDVKEDKARRSSIGLIIGVIIGGCIAFTVVAGIGKHYYLKYKRRSKHENEEVEMSRNENYNYNNNNFRSEVDGDIAN